MPMHGTAAPQPGANNKANEGGGGGGNNSLDPFTRKSSVKKLGKHPKKQQGSSRFRNNPNVEIQPLPLLKGIFNVIFWSVSLFVMNELFPPSKKLQ